MGNDQARHLLWDQRVASTPVAEDLQSNQVSRHTGALAWPLHARYLVCWTRPFSPSSLHYSSLLKSHGAKSDVYFEV